MNDFKLFDYFGWYVDGDDYLYKKLKEQNRNMTTEEESLYFELCKKFLSHKRTAIHIGSHYGFKSKTLSNIFDKVHTFDFDNKINKLMKYNLNKFNIKNIEVHSFGLGNENKRVSNSDFIELKNTNGPLSNHVVENKNGNQFVRRLDDLNINDVDFMLIDTEGYELNVLKGGFETIKKFKPLIILELHRHKNLTKRYGYEKIENIKFLEKLGYTPKGYINDEDILFLP